MTSLWLGLISLWLGLILAIVVILAVAVWFHLRINRARGPRL